jgi:hypothetical protein
MEVGTGRCISKYMEDWRLQNNDMLAIKIVRCR